MIDAHEARKQVFSLETDAGKRDMAAIEEYINKAISQGKCSCTYPWYTSKGVEEHLRALGYNLRRNYNVLDIWW